MAAKKYNCLIIHDYEKATHLLSASLSKTGKTKGILATKSVASAWPHLEKGNIDIVFIRIQHFDEYRNGLSQLKDPPRIIVFLPGVRDKGVSQLQKELDFFVKHPYAVKDLNAIFQRLRLPGFVPCPPDFFFIVLKRKYHVIPLSDLRSAEFSRYEYIILRTDSRDYEVRETLDRVADRLKGAFVRIRHNQLILPQNLSSVDPFSLNYTYRKALGLKRKRTRVAADPVLTAKAVDRLPPRQKMVWQMGQEQKLSYNEIATKMDVSRNTVRNHMMAALRTVRACLQTYSADKT